MLEKLITAVIRKNGSCSSSDINSCSVRVHDNPLLSDCVVGHRLVSDLELAVQDHRADILSILNDSVRNPKYAESGSRHVSASWLFNNLVSLDSSIADKTKALQALNEAPKSSTTESVPPSSSD